MTSFFPNSENVPGGSGAITDITSVDGSVTVTDPTGPVTDLSVTTKLGSYLPLAGGTMTGAIAMGGSKITGLANGTASTDAANYGQVTSAVSGLAPLASPAFTGTPTAPTAAVGTNTTQIATTAFVTAAIAAVEVALASVYLALSGGTMTGPIAMGGSKITGLANGTASNDAAAFGQIPVPANGYGITGNTGATPTPAVGLTVLSGSLSSPVSLGNSVGDVFSTASLAVGTWKIEVGLTVSNAVGASTGEFQVVTNTASATFSGHTSNSVAMPTAGYQESVSLSFVAVVTVAGTVKIQGIGSTVGCTVEAVTTTESWTGASGYTATRIS